MKMNLTVIVFGGLIIFAPVLFIAVILPWTTISEQPSEIFRVRSSLEALGREVYVRNGCTFCHTQFVRDMDWDIGAERVALSGDYVQDQPHLVGTERTGPDLSQEGGSTRMTGTWPILPIPVLSGRNRSCPPGNSWERKIFRP